MFLIVQYFGTHVNGFLFSNKGTFILYISEQEFHPLIYVDETSATIKLDYFISYMNLCEYTWFCFILNEIAGYNCCSMTP